ncbi:alpha-amylase family glycosyl hydrolase [Alloiococcus sp. CFN-8]|uniref:alpha-amylase family glycosyl hydrolase n=1 Tax=Alloiococcus sp. CFN-8 TaxID=3416081 RepID=UPI003CFA1C16
MNFYAFHNSQEEAFRAPFGAVEEGAEVALSIITEGCQTVFLELVHFTGYSERIMMTKADYKELADDSRTINLGNDRELCLWRTEVVLQDTGIAHYYFVIEDNKRILYYGNNNEKLGGEGTLTEEKPIPFQITVYRPFDIPAWYREGIIYQIFVDRFFNGNEDGRIDNPKKNSFLYGTWEDEPMYIKNSKEEVVRWDFFGGNLKGVIKKLPYLKELGVTCIYLNPIFEAASNHKYDAADYKKIDPMFGDDDIFKELCTKAGDLGMKIVLDGVFSHTGADSIYFNRYGNYNSLGAYQSEDSPYYSWYQFRKHPDEYKCWWGFKNHPDVNELNNDYMNFIIKDKDSVVSKWMSLGASGWRLDVADELPDEFIKALRKKVKALNKEGVLIGEVWEDASNKVAYDVKREYFFGEELDSVTNYPFKDALLGFLRGDISSEYMRRKLMSLYENYPKEVFYSTMNLIGTHDTERVLTLLEERNHEKGKELLKMAIAFQMTFPGVPLIYYGDEAGMRGGRDPKNRATYPWGKEDQEMLHYYRKLTGLRKELDILKKGSLTFIDTEEDVVAFCREYQGEKLITAINRSGEARRLVINTDSPYPELRDLVSGEELYIDFTGSLLIERYGIKIIKVN